MTVRSWILRGSALVLSIVWAIWLNYLAMPAWTGASAGFWGYLLSVAASTAFLILIAEAIELCFDEEKFPYLLSAITGSITVVIGLIFVVLVCISSDWFGSAKDYAKAIDIPTLEVERIKTDLPEVEDSTDIPTVDMQTATQLGDRKMGEITENISQYTVSSEYNLISYQGRQVRVTPLEFGGLFEFGNTKGEIPYYILVDIQTNSAKLVKLEEPIRYAPSACYEYKLKRHLRNEYPSYVFGKEQFEIDDEGIPYYVVPVITPTVGLFGARVIERVILVNALTGKTQDMHLEEVPKWVDHVFSVSYLMERIEWNLTLKGGLLNLKFGKKDVKNTSYSYDNNQYYSIVKDGEVYFYTGITSAGNDESNTGFILANLRTGEVNYYPNPGAEESSAQAAAQGVVQEYGYYAGPVMLVNVNGIPTYYMTLKDNQALVQRYALVNKENYSIAIVEKNLSDAVEKYKKATSTETQEAAESISGSGRIKVIYDAIKGGDTYYYFRLHGDETLYESSHMNNIHQVEIEPGDQVTIEYVQIDSNTAIVSKIEIK